MPSDIFSPFSSSRQQIPMVQIPPALLTGPTVRPSTLPRLPAMAAHGGGGGSPVSLMNLMHRMDMDRERLALQQQRLEQGTGEVAKQRLKEQAFNNAMMNLVTTPGLRAEYDQIMKLPAMARLNKLKELEKKYVQPIAQRVHNSDITSKDMFNALFGQDVAFAEVEHKQRTSDATAAIFPNFLKGGATLWAALAGLLPWTDSRDWARWRDEVHKELDEQTEYGRYQRELANAGVGAWDRAEGLSGMANLIAEQALPVGSFFIPNVGLARLGMGARALMGANAGIGALLGAGLTDLDFNSMINNANIPEEQKQEALRSGARAINTGVGALTGAVAPNFAGAAARIPGLRWAGNVVNRAANISPRLGGAANAALGMAGLTTAQVPVTNWAYQSQTNPYLPPEEQQHDLFAGYGDALRLAALTGGLVGGITGYRPPVPAAPVTQPTPAAQPAPQNTTTTPLALPPAESSNTAPTEQNTPLALPMGAIAPPYDIPFAAEGETIVTPYEAPLALPSGQSNTNINDTPRSPTTGSDTSRTPTPEEQSAIIEYYNTLFNPNTESQSSPEVLINDPVWGLGTDFTAQVGTPKAVLQNAIDNIKTDLTDLQQAKTELQQLSKVNKDQAATVQPRLQQLQTKVNRLNIAVDNALNLLNQQYGPNTATLTYQRRSFNPETRADIRSQTNELLAPYIFGDQSNLLDSARPSQSLESYNQQQAGTLDYQYNNYVAPTSRQNLPLSIEQQLRQFSVQNQAKGKNAAPLTPEQTIRDAERQLSTVKLLQDAGIIPGEVTSLEQAIAQVRTPNNHPTVLTPYNAFQPHALEEAIAPALKLSDNVAPDRVTGNLTPGQQQALNQAQRLSDEEAIALLERYGNGRPPSNNTQTNSGVAASAQGNASTVTSAGTSVTRQNNTTNTSAGTRGQQTSQLGTNASDSPINQEQTLNPRTAIRPNGESPTDVTSEDSSAGSPRSTTDGGTGDDKLSASPSTNQRPTDNINQTFKDHLTNQPITAQNTVTNYVAFLDTVNNLTGSERNAVLAQSILKSAELAGWQGAKNKAGNYFLTPKYPDLNTALTDAAQEYHLKNDTLPDLPLEDFINYYNQHSEDNVQYTKDRLITGNKSVTTTRVREFTNKFLQNIKRVEPLNPKDIASSNAGCS